jgi:hypothetical protein
MRLKQSRVAPLSQAEWNGETREVLEGSAGWHVYNIFAMLVPCPKLSGGELLETCAPIGDRRKTARVTNPRAGFHPAPQPN